MACDLEALFTVEQKLRSIFANPSFVRRRARRINNIAGDDGVRLLPFKSINSLGDPQQHLLQALAASLSLLGLQPPLSDSFARWCSSNDLEFDLEAAGAGLKQLLLLLCLQKRHINAVYADSRALSQLIQKYGVLDDPAFVADDCDAVEVAVAASSGARTASAGSGVRSAGSTWELKVIKLNIGKTNGKYKKSSLNLNIHDSFFSPRLQPHANSPADGWYLRARLLLDDKSASLDHWFSPIFPKSMQISLMPNVSFVEELGQTLAAGSDQDVLAYLQGCKLTVELWRHKPKRNDFVIFSCSSYLKHQSLGLSTSTITLQPDSASTNGKPAAAASSKFSISGVFELIITRRKVAETLKPTVELGHAAEQVESVDPREQPHAAAEPHWHADEAGLVTELDNEFAVLRNWTFMSAAAALLVQHDTPPNVVNTVMYLYCFTSGFAAVHARDCLLIARALTMKCAKTPLVEALEMLLLSDGTELPRSYSASDVYALVDTTRLALRVEAVDLIVMSARNYLENVMLYPHELQRDCLLVLLKIAGKTSRFDEGSHDTADTLTSQLQCCTQAWNSVTVQSIRSMSIVMEASGDMLKQRLLTLSILIRRVSDELKFQLADIAPMYPAHISPKQTIARSLCSQVVVYTQAFIIEGSDDDKFDSDLLVQLFEGLLRVIDLLKRHDCLIESESLSQLFHEMFPLWLSSIEVAFTRQLESARAVDDVGSMSGVTVSPLDSEDGGSETLRAIDALFQSSTVLLVIPSLDADLHQLFWDVVLRVSLHAVSAMTSAFSRDIQDTLILEGGMSDSAADACIAACAHAISPAQFLSDLDASRKDVGGLYLPGSSWGRIIIAFSSPMHFLTSAILNRACIAHSVATYVRDFATYDLNKSDNPEIALLPHAALMSLSKRFLVVFEEAFLMACNVLTVLCLQMMEHTLAQEEIQVQQAVDEVCRMCRDMLDCCRSVDDVDAVSSASALIFQAVSKACVMAAFQMKHGDLDRILFLDALQVKLMAQLKELFVGAVDDDGSGGRYGKLVNTSSYLDAFKCLVRSGIEGDVGVLLMSTQDLLFEHTKLRNGKVGNSPLGIRDLQAVLIRRAKCGDAKAIDHLHSFVEEPTNWRKKFDVTDSETSFLVAACHMRVISDQNRKRPNIFSNDSGCRGCFILTKFHCAFIPDDAEDRAANVCFVIAQLSHFAANHRNATINLSGLPKVSITMFHIRVHVIEVVGIDEEVTMHFSLCGQSWSPPSLRRRKSRAADSGSPWIESRLVCKDLPESQYPSKFQLAESPPLAVDTVPASLTVHMSKGSFDLGQGGINVGEVSSLAVNDFVIKVALATGSVDMRVFVTVVPSSLLHDGAPQQLHVELAGFSRIKEVSDRFASHLSDIGLDDSVSIEVTQDIVSNQDSTALGVDFSNLLPAEQLLGKFSCTLLGQSGVFNKDTPGTLVVTKQNIYFFNRDLVKVLNLSVHMIEEGGLKRTRHRLSDAALSMQLIGEGSVTHLFSNFGQGTLNAEIQDQAVKLISSLSSADM